MPKKAEPLFKSAFAKIGYTYDTEESSSLSDIYCESKQVQAVEEPRTRGLRGNGIVDDVNLNTYIPLGLRAKGAGEIEIADDVTVEHLARDEFEGFRRFLGLSEEEYQRSFAEVTGGAVSDGGRSGSLYWFSADKRYLLKTASSSDLDKLVDMMPRYLEHFKAAEKEGRPCFLLRFFGAYRFRAGNEVLGLICMNDVWDGKKPSRIYDLKGTTQHRYVDVGEEEPKGVVLKDLNLDSYFIIGKAQGSKVWDAFAKDAEFLENENSIDYSLLLGIDDAPVAGLTTPEAPKARDSARLPCYQSYEYPEEDMETQADGWRKVRLGIIDFLGQWNSKKKAERWYKTFKGCCDEHSSMPPDYYRDRWVRFLEDKIVVEDSYKS